MAVFESPPDSIRKRVGKQDAPFPIVGDPGRVLYRKYRVEASLAGLIVGTFRPSMLRAFAKGFLPGKIDSTVTHMPADFLIDEEGVIRVAHYGRDIGDHLELG
ncbi:MAG: hypothetical protein ACE5FJ_03105 [Gemmatimonadales bacterium]